MLLDTTMNVNSAATTFQVPNIWTISQHVDIGRFFPLHPIFGFGRRSLADLSQLAAQKNKTVNPKISFSEYFQIKGAEFFNIYSLIGRVRQISYGKNSISREQKSEATKNKFSDFYQRNYTYSLSLFIPKLQRKASS